MSHCFIEAIRSVTHLVLAPRIEKALLVLCFLFFLLKASSSLSLSFFVFPVTDCAHPATAGPENLQYRLAFIQLVRALVWPALIGLAPASNTFLTRDTVESPAKRFPSSFTSMLKFPERRRLQSVLRADANTCTWLTAALKI